MTALREYQRLEATALWRASPDAQRADVVVSIGDATLVITDLRDKALTHWSLPAVKRANPGQIPAIYYPDGDPGETLELAENEGEMIEAIERLRAVIERRRPHPGRLRLVIYLLSLAAVVTASALWLPGALRRHAVTVVPDVKRAEIGAELLVRIQRVTGPPCRNTAGNTALSRLAARLSTSGRAEALAVMRDGVRTTVHLPGGMILINRSLVEDYEEPDVLAGFLIAEQLRSEHSDPLADLLNNANLWVSFKLLTTGDLDEETLRSYAENLLTSPQMALPDTQLLNAFEARSVRSTPYAYAVDISGETTLGLIEADPFSNEAPPAILSDADWLQLQSICGG